jgi:hypothetical protein
MNSPQQPNVALETLMQTQANTAAATQQQQMNMVDQNNAYGSLTYSPDSASPSGYAANTTLSPIEQQIFNEGTQAQATEGGIANTLASSGAGALSGQGPDLGFSGINAQVNSDEENTLNPQWAAAGNQEAATLAAEGVMPGSEEYTTQMQQFNNSKNTAYDQMFVGDQAQAQQEALTAYDAPLNALTALQSGSQVTTPNSSLVATPQESITAPNTMGATQANYNNATAQYDAALGGLASLGGTLGGAGIKAFSSDREDKTDISKLGKDSKTGLEMYAYRYKGDPKSYPKTVGPMAQEIEKKAPGAVRSIGGHKVVTPGGLGVIARRRAA